MATQGNWGKARNLRIYVVDEPDEATLIATTNAWLVGRKEEEIIFMHFQIDVYGSPAVEHLHAFIIYTEE